MKKYWKVSLVTLTVLAVLTVLGGAYPLYRYLTHERYQERLIEVRPISYEFIANRKGIVISWKRLSKNSEQGVNNRPVDYNLAIYGKRYISTQSYRLIHKFDDNRFDVKKMSWGEYWKIQVYDTSTGKLTRKEYDLLEAVRDYDASYFPVSITYVHFFAYKGQEYRTVVLQETGGHDRKEVLFNLATGKIEDIPKEAESAFEGRNNELFNLSTSLRDYYADDIGNLSSSIRLPKSVIKQSSDWRLKEEYSKAYELMAREKGQLYFLANDTDVRLLSDIYSLLIPRDKQLFDNLTVYGDVTKDGQDHVVNSYEEFISVLKPKEELRNGK